MGYWGMDDDDFESLIGAKIEIIRMNEDYLVFGTDKGEIIFTVEGDCCSYSYFFDFYGVKNLLELGPVTAFEEVELSLGDPGYHDPNCGGYNYDSDSPAPCGRDHEYIQVYGHRLTVEHPQYGPVSAVFSFRNDSNGYYGGWMTQTTSYSGKLETLTADKVG